MLTQTQEERLRQALTLLVEAVPEHTQLEATAPAQRRRRPEIALLAGFAVILAGFVPFLLMRNSGNEAQQDATSTTMVGATAAPPGISLGEPTPLGAPPWQVSGVAAEGDALYAVTVGHTDQVLMSHDRGATWETILEADPGDAEGIFAAGQQIVLVANDDDPARDTVEPHSVVTDAPRVLIYDPATGRSSEVTLPRPEDPVMTGIPLDSDPDVTHCALGGYQSWAQASGVAIGDRILVIGTLKLVGQFPDGSTICDGQTYRSLVWTSEDAGASWALHDGPALADIAWTGSQFVAWSVARADDGEPYGTKRTLFTSPDGVDWTETATTPSIPDGAFLSGTSISATDGRIIASAGVWTWSTVTPDGIMPLGAVIAVSDDDGTTWKTEYVSIPITEVTVAGGELVALAPVEAAGEGFSTSTLIASTDGSDWTEVAALPVDGFEVRSLAATPSAIYVATGGVWRIPLEASP